MFSDLTYRAVSAIYDWLYNAVEFVLSNNGYPIYGLLLVALIHSIGLSIMVSVWCLLLVFPIVILFAFSVAMIEYSNGLCDAIGVQRQHIEAMESINSDDSSISDILKEMQDKVAIQGFSSVSEYFRALESEAAANDQTTE